MNEETYPNPLENGTSLTQKYSIKNGDIVTSSLQECIQLGEVGSMKKKSDQKDGELKTLHTAQKTPKQKNRSCILRTCGEPHRQPPCLYLKKYSIQKWAFGVKKKEKKVLLLGLRKSTIFL